MPDATRVPHDAPHSPPRPLATGALQALAARVWARQAPSTRWREVRQGDAPPQGTSALALEQLRQQEALAALHRANRQAQQLWAQQQAQRLGESFGLARQRYYNTLAVCSRDTLCA